VFWGFCAFALVTINHFGEAVGLHLVSRESWIGKFYFYLAAAFGVAVAVSIAGLAFRRFVIRPRWLGKVHWESGFIAFLIFTLMVTYLATFLGDNWEHSKALWWAHTLSILIFMPLIPHTKHLHLVLSPITVFLKRDQFSKIPPLSGDEDFGLDTGKDLTQLVGTDSTSLYRLPFSISDYYLLLLGTHTISGSSQCLTLYLLQVSGIHTGVVV